MNNPTELNIDADRPELQGFREFYTRKIEPHMAGRRNQQRTARRWLLGFGPTGLVVTGLVGWLMFRSYGLNWLTVTLPSGASASWCLRVSLVNDLETWNGKTNKIP
jgi:hypothetical protein